MKGLSKPSSRIEDNMNLSAMKPYRDDPESARSNFGVSLRRTAENSPVMEFEMHPKVNMQPKTSSAIICTIKGHQIKLLWIVFVLMVGGYAISRYEPSNKVQQGLAAPSTTDPSCYPAEAKSVKIETADAQLLNIFEVKAFSSDDVNIALTGDASQSSTLNSGTPASNAIDGSDTTVAHTANGDPNPWWQVDFASSSSLKSVEIKNRHCAGAPVCLCRLSGATVSVTNELGEVIDTKILGNTCEVSDISLDLSTCSESP
ncbi:hypothetical protein ACHAWO_002601 [Cyclotella atomus]|uniref:Fucolectin tachylectin-4 pentraxin-1 domain-containing protein n=1 Tax=Cyclotella atomus TaxID=382360 RepID=A0ABD3P5J7_9STRA